MIGNIYISGQIGTFDDVKGVELIDVVGQVKKQPEATEFNVYIDSEGGLVDVGFDIYNYLKSLGKPINTIGSGIVASIATVIFMSGVKRSIRENTPFMIHLPFMTIEGNGTADDLLTLSEDMRATEKQLIDFYKKSLSLEEEAIRPLLKNETWLTQEQLKDLGFTTSEPFKAVAKAYLKTNNNKDMTDKDKNWMEGLFNKVLSKFKSDAKNKVVQDANGAELDFTELADDAVIEVGAIATVDGNPAEGEYAMPSGEVYVFEAGELKEIKPVNEDDEMATLRDENESLKQQLADSQAQSVASAKKLKDMKNEVETLKSQVMSKFTVDGKKNPPKSKDKDDDKDSTAGMKNYLKSKRGN